MPIVKDDEPKVVLKEEVEKESTDKLIKEVNEKVAEQLKEE